MFNVIDNKDRRICFRYFLIIIDMKGDFIDLEKFLPTEERVQSPNELRIKQAAAHILNPLCWRNLNGLLNGRS